MAEQDYEHSGPEDNSSEEDHAALVHKALPPLSQSRQSWNYWVTTPP